MVTVIDAKAVLLLPLFETVEAWLAGVSFNSDCGYNTLFDESFTAEQLLDEVVRDILLLFLDV